MDLTEGQKFISEFFAARTVDSSLLVVRRYETTVKSNEFGLLVRQIAESCHMVPDQERGYRTNLVALASVLDRLTDEGESWAAPTSQLASTLAILRLDDLPHDLLRRAFSVEIFYSQKSHLPGILERYMPLLGAQDLADTVLFELRLLATQPRPPIVQHMRKDALTDLAPIMLSAAAQLGPSESSCVVDAAQRIRTLLGPPTPDEAPSPTYGPI